MVQSDRKLNGVVGGSIGSDPFGRQTWSMISFYFFTALQRRGVLARAFGADLPSWRRFPLLAKNFHLRRRVWRKRFYMDPSYRDSLTKLLTSLIRPGDLKHDFLQIGAMFNLSSSLKGKVRCFSYHDGNLAELLRSGFATRGLSRKRILAALDYERKVYHGMHRVFAMSEYLRQSFISDFDVPAQSVVNVGGGINLDCVPEYNAEKDYSRREILFVGIDFERKGGPELIQSFTKVIERYKNAQLHIVGPRRLSIPGHLKNHVTHHGFIRKDDAVGKTQLDELYRACSLFVMPSRYEPFGVAPLEAMVHQIPSLVTNGWALKEMVRPGVSGDLLERGSVQDITDKLEYYLRDPDRLRVMGDAARETVLARYTWDAVASRITAALD